MTNKMRFISTGIPASHSRREFIAVATLSAALPMSVAHSEGTFPSQPLSLVVPFPPGGVADIVARSLAVPLQRLLGQSVVVLNKPGAGGAIGAASVANAKPDGYSLLIALTSLSTNPEQEIVNNRPAPFQLKQLAPVARISTEDMMLAVPAASNYRSIPEIVAEAKRRPGMISYASSGNYGVYHIATEMFNDAAKIKLNHIPYSGGAPAMLALLSGQVDLGLVTRSVGLSHIQSGKVRPIAAWGNSRWQDYAEVPTISEMGYDVPYTLWSGLFVHSDTPVDVINSIRRTVAAAVADSSFTTTMKSQGVKVAYLDAPEFDKFWKSESERLIKVVRRIGKLQ